MTSIRVARRYAAALMATAAGADQLRVIGEDLERIDAVLRGSRELVMVLKSPVISSGKKTAVLDAIFGTRLSDMTKVFLRLLVAKGREDHLSDIIVQFRALRDLREGTIAVDVVSAVALTPAQQRELTRELASYTQKQVRLGFRLDPAIRGGMIVRLGDTVLDGSLRRQLERLRDQLADGAPVAA